LGEEVQRGGGTGEGDELVQRGGNWARPRPLLAVPNVASTASAPITVLLYDGLFLCGFNVEIKGLK